MTGDVRRDHAGPSIETMARDEGGHRHLAERLTEISDDRQDANVDLALNDVVPPTFVDRNVPIGQEACGDRLLRRLEPPDQTGQANRAVVPGQCSGPVREAGVAGVRDDPGPVTL